MNNIRYTPILYSIILLIGIFNISSLFVVVTAEEEDVGSKVALFSEEDEIPSILVSNWTSINLTVVDMYDFNWSELKLTFPEWYMKLVWPFLLGMPDIDRYLGFTSVEFQTEIVKGNPDGWFLYLHPDSISETTNGYEHKVTLDVMVDKNAADYGVTIGIKSIRKDTWSEVEGTSYWYMPVKAAAFNYVEAKALKPTKKTSPKSMVYYTMYITNKGFYEDIFQFRVEAENGLLGTVQEQALVIKPGETKPVTLEILTPEKFFDPGTSNKVNIYVYSKGDPQETLAGNVIVVTEGFFVSPLLIIVIAIITILLIIAYFILSYLKKRGKADWLFNYFKKGKKEQKTVSKKQKQKSKPKEGRQKPSENVFTKLLKRSISEEKPVEVKGEGVFAKLFKRESSVGMEKPVEVKEKKGEGVFAKLFKRESSVGEEKPVEVKEEKETGVFTKLFKKPEEKTEEIKPEEIEEEEKRIRAEMEAEREKRRREKALLKIKREQEKQKKKLESST